eukprot:3129258-Amphidinium_carterae.2
MAYAPSASDFYMSGISNASCCFRHGATYLWSAAYSSMISRYIIDLRCSVTERRAMAMPHQRSQSLSNMLQP